jgi:hypothetical protein
MRGKISLRALMGKERSIRSGFGTTPVSFLAKFWQRLTEKRDGCEGNFDRANGPGS